LNKLPKIITLLANRQDRKQRRRLISPTRTRWITSHIKK